MTKQGQWEHVSSVVLAEAEVDEHLDFEKDIREAAGWVIEAAIIEGSRALVCRRNKAEVVLFARSFSPLEDIQAPGAQ